MSINGPTMKDFPVLCLDEKPLFGIRRPACHPAARARRCSRTMHLFRECRRLLRRGTEFGRYFNKETDCRDGRESSIFMTDLPGHCTSASKIALVMNNLPTRSCGILHQHLGTDCLT
jgi:hypothetical protein